MIVNTDYSMKSGIGTPMFSKMGKYTISNYKCFADKKPGEISLG
jgi:hypothetical protein